MLTRIENIFGHHINARDKESTRTIDKQSIRQPGTFLPLPCQQIWLLSPRGPGSARRLPRTIDLRRSRARCCTDTGRSGVQWDCRYRIKRTAQVLMLAHAEAARLEVQIATRTFQYGAGCGLDSRRNREIFMFSCLKSVIA